MQAALLSATEFESLMLGPRGTTCTLEIEREVYCMTIPSFGTCA